jgi:hypothetical protein
MRKPSLPTGTKLYDLFLVVSAVVVVTAFYLS